MRLTNGEQWWLWQVCWSDDGERFGGLGDGGVVATWRLDAPRMQASDTGYLGRSDWCHQVYIFFDSDSVSQGPHF